MVLEDSCLKKDGFTKDSLSTAAATGSEGAFPGIFLAWMRELCL